MFAPATALQLTREERAEIDHIVANGRTPQKLARRARIIALAADGTPNRQIAMLVGVSRPTVIAQRRRFEEAAAQSGLPVDEDFLLALAEGMPPAGGIALGLDRLAMLFAGEPDIDFVRWF